MAKAKKAATSRKKTPPRERKTSTPKIPKNAGGQRVQATTKIKDITVGKKTVKVSLDALPVHLRESNLVTRWIEQEVKVLIKFDDVVVAATILTETKITRGHTTPKFNGLRISNRQVADLTRILQDDPGTVHIEIIPDTLGLFDKQMDEDDGFTDGGDRDEARVGKGWEKDGERMGSL